MISIAVQGYAEREFTAERAVVEARIEVEGAEREDVVTRAAAVHARLTERARRLVETGATTKWHAETVAVGSSPAWAPDGTRAEDVQRASAGITLRFRDFIALTEWTSELADDPLVRLVGISWDIAEAGRAERIGAVRADAVADAMARAAIYATAAGAGGASLVAIYEDGLRPGAGSAPAPMQARMMSMSADRAGGSDGGFDLTPRPYRISVDLSADFTA